MFITVVKVPCRDMDLHIANLGINKDLPDDYAAIPCKWKNKAPKGFKFTVSRWVTLTSEDVEFLEIGDWECGNWSTFSFDGRKSPGLVARLKTARCGPLERIVRNCESLSPEDRRKRCEICGSNTCPKSKNFGKKYKRAPLKPLERLGWKGDPKRQPRTRPLVGGPWW